LLSSYGDRWIQFVAGDQPRCTIRINLIFRRDHGEISFDKQVLSLRQRQPPGNEGRRRLRFGLWRNSSHKYQSEQQWVVVTLFEHVSDTLHR
jgi:hypothetical protein